MVNGFIQSNHAPGMCDCDACMARQREILDDTQSCQECRSQVIETDSESYVEPSVAHERQPLLESATPARTPLPKRQVAALLFVIFPESVTSTLIYPFVVELVRSLHIVKGTSSFLGKNSGNPAAVGYYTGLIESCFFFTEAICVSIWSHVSDRVGRKPVILFGSLGLAAALWSFGSSTTLLGIMASRSLQGALNGNVGVARAMLTELTDLTNRDQAFSFIPVVWASGSTLGPLIGGLLAKPAEKFSLFDVPFWRSHPYLLPCVVAACLPISAFVSTLTLVKETHSIPNGIIQKISNVATRISNISKSKISSTSYGTMDRPSTNGNATNGQGSPMKSLVSKEDYRLSQLLTPRLLRVLLNHALLAVLEHSYLALVALFYATPVESGGLGLPPSILGLLLGTTGLVHGVLQPFCFSPLYRRFHPKNLYTVCIAASLPAYACFPCINALARAHGTWSPGVWVLVVFQAFLLLPSYTTFSAINIFISTSAPTPTLLGTTMGFAQTLFSSMGAIGPSGVTSLFAVSQEKNLLGGNLVYVVMCGIVVIAILASHFVLPDDPHLVPEQSEIS